MEVQVNRYLGWNITVLHMYGMHISSINFSISSLTRWHDNSQQKKKKKKIKREEKKYKNNHISIVVVVYIVYVVVDGFVLLLLSSACHRFTIIVWWFFFFLLLYYFFLLASGKIIATKTKSVAECKHELNMQMLGKRLTIICLVLIRGGSVSNRYTICLFKLFCIFFYENS